MTQDKNIAASILGTSAMTLSSYIVSDIKDNNFKEPEILGKLISRLYPFLKKEHGQIAGWTLHYLVGLLFAEIYAPLWEKTSMQPNLKNGLILGGISGIAAILIWKFTLEMHPDPVQVNFKKYAGHLFIAHVIFGLFVVAGYNFMSKDKLRPGDL